MCEVRLRSRHSRCHFERVSSPSGNTRVRRNAPKRVITLSLVGHRTPSPYEGKWCRGISTASESHFADSPRRQR